MQQLPGEATLLESSDKVLALTTHRVRYHASAIGAGDVVSIMLDEVASCGVVYNSHPLLILLAALAALGAFAGPSDSRIALLVIAAMLVAAYFASRKHVLAIASAGHTIKCSLQGMKAEQVLNFIEQTEAAKNRRYEGAVVDGARI